MVDTYTKPLAQMEGRPAPIGIDTRQISAFTSALYDKAKAEEDQKAFAEGYQEQRLLGTKELVHEDEGWFDFDSTHARNKGRQVAFSVGKQTQLQSKLIEIEQQFPNDPEAAQAALSEYQQEYFSGFDEAPEALPAYQKIYDESAADAVARIKLSQIKTEKAKQAAITLDGLEQKTINVENIVGQGGDASDAIQDIEAQTWAMVDAGLLDADAAVKNLRQINVRATRSSLTGQLRRGEKSEPEILNELLDPTGPYAGLSVMERDYIGSQIQQVGNQMRSGLAADRTAFDQTADAIVKQVARGNKYDRDALVASLDRLQYTTTERAGYLAQFDAAVVIGNDYTAFTGGGLFSQKTMVEEARKAADVATGNPLTDELNDARYERLAGWYAESQAAFTKDPHGEYARQTGLVPDPTELQDEMSVSEYQTRVAMYSGNPDVSPLPPSMITERSAEYAATQGADGKMLKIMDIKSKYGKHAKKILSDMGLDGTTILASGILGLGPEFQNEAGLVFQAGLNATANEEAFKSRKEDRDALEEAAGDAFPDVKFGLNGEIASQHRSAVEQVAMELMRTDPDLDADGAAAKAIQMVMRGKSEVEVGGETMILDADDDAEALDKTIVGLGANPLDHGVVIPQGMTLDQYRSYLNDETKTLLVPTNDGTGYWVVDKVYQTKAMVETPGGPRPLVIRKDGSIAKAKFQPVQGKSMWEMNVALTPNVEQVEMSDPPAGEFGNDFAAGFGVAPVEQKSGKVKVERTEDAASVAQRAFLEVQKAGLEDAETFARIVTNQSVLQDQLTGVSAMIAQGNLDGNALEVLSQHSEFNGLNDPSIRRKVVEAWKDPANRTGTDATGQRKTPLHALHDLVRRTPRDQPMMWRGGQTSQVQPEVNPTGERVDLQSVLRARESENNYAVENDGGYVGAYQFGVRALADLGMVKPEALDGRSQKEILGDDASWTIEGGKAAFLEDKALQDQLMTNWTALLERRLRREGLIDSSTPKDVKNGMIAVAHLLGVGGAKRFAAGGDPEDGNGTKASEYFELGKGAL